MIKDNWGSRIYYMDNLRAVAMFLGLVLHAAVFYNSWPLPAGKLHPENSEILHIVVEMIHVFRMELFFLVAGFFACLLMKRKSLKALVKNRFSRIFLPFLLCFFILQPWWSTIQVKMVEVKQSGFWGTYFNHFTDLLTIVKYEFPIGQWFQHLWFLQLLIIFISIQCILVTLADKFSSISSTSILIRRLFRSNLGIYAIIFVSYFTLLLCPPWADVPNIGSPLNIVGYYGFYYFVGFFIFNSPSILDHAIQNLKYNIIPLGIGLVIVISSVSFTLLSAPIEILRQDWSMFKGTLSDGKVDWSVPLIENIYNFSGLTRGDFRWHAFSFLKSYTTWFTIILFIFLFKKFCNTENPVWRYLSQSSYWVYILHFPLQFTLYHYLFNDLIKSPLIGFFVILVISLVICLFSYHYFVRSTLIGVFLNGRKFSKNIDEEKGVLKGFLRTGPIAAGFTLVITIIFADQLERNKDYRITQYSLWKKLELVDDFIKENPEKTLIARRSDGRSALHMAATSFYRSPSFKPESGTVEKIIDRLLNEGIKVDNTDLTGQTPLHYAVRTGHLDAVKKLCSEGANPNHPAKWQKLSPLHLASVLGDEEIIEELLKNGGDPKLKQSRGESSYELYKIFHDEEFPAI